MEMASLKVGGFHQIINLSARGGAGKLSFLVDLKWSRQSIIFQVQIRIFSKRRSNGLMFLSLRSGELINNGVSLKATPPMVVVEERRCSGGYAARRFRRLPVDVASSGKRATIHFPPSQ
jgi:hypothetical protein